MCGIAGWIYREGKAPAAQALDAMTDAIAHRGPDGAGKTLLVRDGYQIALGHRRLAIIDLEGGKQPMTDAGGRFHLVFNGEIYNFRELTAELTAKGHQFQTHSDSEVIIEAYRAWGPAMVERLGGMFAFALFDRETGQTLIARDRFGKKPLFLGETGDGVIFASEIKSILASGLIEPRMDEGAAGLYHLYRYVPGPRTFFAGITKLPPGHYALWRNGQLSQQRYWSPPDEAPPQIIARADPVTDFRAALAKAVRQRLVSDVPFGAFLSGGIDSSVIVALMAREIGQVECFSVGFEEAGFSELDYARLAALHSGARHHTLTIRAGDVMDELPKLTRFRDAPVAEPADVPMYRLSLDAARQVKMVLTGEGSDELLGGYPKHGMEAYAARYRALIPQAIHNGLVRPLIGALPYQFRRIKILADTMAIGDAEWRYPAWFGSAPPDLLQGLLATPADVAGAVALAPETVGPLRRILHFDQVSWLPDNLLERGDRMTMAGSIEGRMPFMDHDLAAFVSTLPDHWRVRGRRTKVILREAARDLIPGDILNRPKVGFRVPVEVWFRSSLKDWLNDLLTGPSALSTRHYRPGAVARILEDHATGKRNWEKLIWSMMALELFQREYGLS